MNVRPFRHVQPGPEPTRARYPDGEGHIEREGVKVVWERHGDGQPTLLYLASAWPITHSRIWRGQIPYFARHHRVLTIDPRGNGRSSRPRDPESYAVSELAQDAIDVLDATGTERALLVSGARGAQTSLLLAAEYAERVLGIVLLGPQPRNQRQMVEAMLKGRLDSYEGWDKFNPEYWREDYHGFVEWFAEQNCPEGHNSRGKEAFIEYALETDPGTLITASAAPGIRKSELPGIAARVRCPALVVCGEFDTINPPELSREVADLLDAPLVTIPGTGHGMFKGAVQVMLLIREFAESLR